MYNAPDQIPSDHALPKEVVVHVEGVVLAVQQHLRRSTLKYLQIAPQCFYDMVADEIVFKFRTLLRATGGEEYITRYPADWWQHFKERWAPLWVKRRWPVRYLEVRLRRFARLCPHEPFASSSQHLHFLADHPDSR